MDKIFPLPDMTSIPPIGSRERDAHEEAALERGRELVHANNGSLRDALFDLEQELRGTIGGQEIYRDSHVYYDTARDYSRALVSHVEQCWATAIVR